MYVIFYFSQLLFRFFLLCLCLFCIYVYVVCKYIIHRLISARHHISTASYSCMLLQPIFHNNHYSSSICSSLYLCTPPRWLVGMVRTISDDEMKNSRDIRISADADSVLLLLLLMRQTPMYQC